MTAFRLNRPIEPLKSSGQSANLAYYGEPAPDGRERPGRVWCDVLRSIPLVRGADGALALDRSQPVTYYISVYVSGRRGAVAKTKTTRPLGRAPERLPARTVTRLVREALS